jgi:glycosyltransferase involved in cell wall biosynthesis
MIIQPSMRVLLVNTSERTGGAAIACNRLMNALKKSNVKAKMLVRDKQSDRIVVVPIKPSFMLPLKFLWERFVIFLANRLHRKGIFLVDIANTGTDITKMRDFQQADIIHLHWTNQGFLSMSDIRKIIRTGKPVVITMHDMWYFTGICHYASSCQKYKTQCEHCEQLADGKSPFDLASRVFNKKKQIYSLAPITFVGCSKWIADLARQSALTKGHTIVNIPNPIDMNIFRPIDKMEVRRKLGFDADKKIILFGAQRITDERKGFHYLAEACNLIKQNNPTLAANISIIVVGGDSAKIQNQIPFTIKSVSYVKQEEQMVELYNAADIYVTPSLQDNLPNTIVEAMACGIPCVGFNVGGIPEMIDHKKNGYVAEFKNAADFAQGIEWTLSNDYPALSAAAHQKAVDTYSETTVANKFKEIYDNACNGNI